MAKPRSLKKGESPIWEVGRKAAGLKRNKALTIRFTESELKKVEEELNKMSGSKADAILKLLGVMKMTVKDLKTMILVRYENETLFFKDSKNNIYDISWTSNAEDEKEIIICDLTSFFKENTFFVEKSYASDNSVNLADDLEVEIFENVEYDYSK